MRRFSGKENFMPYQIWNRRYTGSKYKLSNWITELITDNCKGTSFCDIFAGTAVVSKNMIDYVDDIYINDFLYSNEIIYKAFFEQSDYDENKLTRILEYIKGLNSDNISKNYISENYGNKYFSYNDSLLIGSIRECFEESKDLNDKEKAILIASLLFSADKAANTVGHYDAYIKGKDIPNSFKFDLICPYKYPDKKIHISRKDANILAKEIQCDIVYIDPPYNSRQYSRFYHVLENIATWKKPELFGVACKPREENMSDYCRTAATRVFDDLITSLNCKYIAVSYNNTYNSKSSSSRNKITLEELERVLSKRGTVRRFEKAHQAFNAGKTELNNHKEFLFLVKVGE